MLRRARPALFALAALLLACRITFPRSYASDTSDAAGEAAVVQALQEAMSALQPLASQVEAGNVVPGFGERARSIVSKARARAGPSGSYVERAVEGLLEPLFLTQVYLLRQRAADEVEAILSSGTRPPMDVIDQAERRFKDSAADLVPSQENRWSLEPERAALRRGLLRRLQQGAAIIEERARTARVQRITMEVIGKLQDQMDQLQQKVQGARGGGSPWVLSTSYRIPKTPLQVVGRYEQGRANLELNLSPEKDPTNSDSGFAGIGPANLGVSFNLAL